MSEFLELVKSRRSVRTFDGQRLNNAVVENLRPFQKV